MINGSRFLCALVFATACWALLIVAWISLVDPYGLEPEGGYRGFNLFKISDPWEDGRVMRLVLLLRQPRTILLGSSRMVLSTDETRLKGTVYWPAYNASTYNSGLDHRLSMLRYAAMVDRRLNLDG